MATIDPSSRLATHFHGASNAESTKKWNELWLDGYVPWDKGFPSPALVDLLENTQHLPAPASGRKKALVPGCGKGYDVLLLSAWGYDAYGLDLSEKALEEAKKFEKETSGKEIYAKKESIQQKGNVTWLLGDFFDDDILKDVEGEKTFDLIYDYTFLCALNPSMRPAWSKRHVQLLAPEGRLVCLEFPTYKPITAKGPPWGCPPRVYLEHLSCPGQEVPHGEEDSLIEQQQGPPAEDGLQRIAHFQPERTHQIGYDEHGIVTDWVSIWSHRK